MTRADARVREAAKLGFRRCVLPKSGRDSRQRDARPIEGGIELAYAGTLAEALAFALE